MQLLREAEVSHDDAAPRHVPVLADRVAELLAPALTGGGLLIDATLGLGGHAERLLHDHPNIRLLGLDRDPRALAHAQQRLQPFADRITVVHTPYHDLAQVLRQQGMPATGGVRAVLFDLGVSSLQLDEPQRGFAYAVDAPLDMRMDPTTGPTAADVLKSYSRDELTRVLRDYGEERFAARIAAQIVRRRGQQPFLSSAQLVQLLYEVIPAPARRRGGHPAKRTFQALRVEVNGELASLSAALPAALQALVPGGRIVVLSYQSLEDRLVKRVLTQASRSRAPLDLPVEPAELAPEFRLVSKGAEQASAAEIAANPRAAAVRLRAAQRIREVR